MYICTCMTGSTFRVHFVIIDHTGLNTNVVVDAGNTSIACAVQIC